MELIEAEISDDNSGKIALYTGRYACRECGDSQKPRLCKESVGRVHQPRLCLVIAHFDIRQSRNTLIPSEFVTFDASAVACNSSHSNLPVVRRQELRCFWRIPGAADVSLTFGEVRVHVTYSKKKYRTKPHLESVKKRVS